MKNWDYKLPKNWKPKTDSEWKWYLERRINYGDLVGLSAQKIRHYFSELKLDPGMHTLLKNYFQAHGT